MFKCPTCNASVPKDCHCREQPSAPLAASSPPDKLLQIAGLVNSYHNDGTTLTAAQTLKAIADVLGDPFDAASSPPARPDGWLDGEIALTAFALAHPDCDVRAVLQGFADWILTGSQPAWEPRLKALIATWREDVRDPANWNGADVGITNCANELAALLSPPPKEQP